MSAGFYIIMAAQFFSALADNALLIAAIAILRDMRAPAEYEPLLKTFFTVSYVALAAFVGAFADSMPKWRVMFISNGIKIFGCSLMFFDVHPLLAYAVVGLGAAAYSPAKYGILTEYLPHRLLVVANGWIEGLTVGAIILGVVLGGALIKPEIAHGLLSLDFPLIDTGIDTIAEMNLLIIGVLYLIAAGFNLYVPDTGVDHKPLKKNPVYLLHEFNHCLRLLWRDKLGQVSLAVTTLFWGAGATLQFIVLEWARVALNLDLSKASMLQGIVAIGVAAGAILAAKMITLRKSVRVIPLGIAMGIGVMVMILVRDFFCRCPAAGSDRHGFGILRRADERVAAAPRTHTDGRRPLDCGTELQRKPVDPDHDNSLLPADQGQPAHLLDHRPVRPARRRNHVGGKDPPRDEPA